MKLIACKACGTVIDYDILKSNEVVVVGVVKNNIYMIHNEEWFQCRSCFTRNKVEEYYDTQE